MATNKLFTAISHCDRMKNPKYKHKYSVDTVLCDMPVDVEQVDKSSNRVVRTTVYKTPDKSALKSFKVSDFCLENIIAVGATDLQPSMLIRDNLSASDNIDAQLSNLENTNK